MIEVKGLTKTFTTKTAHVTALNNVDIKVKTGEIFGIAGYSGAGKSTLIRCLNLLEIPTSGNVTIDGVAVSNLKGKNLRKQRQKIGMIFQHFNLLSSRTTYGNVAFPLEVAGAKKEEIHKRVIELLKLVGLQDKIGAYPAQLSGGQKQRVGIARALANDPKILLCDEATSALDPDTTQSILSLLRSINKKYNLTIVIITHEIKVIKEICDTAAIMEQGKIIESGTVFELFTKPQKQVTKNFINSVTNQELTGTETLTYHQTYKNPYECQSKLSSDSELIKISFIGSKAQEPIISSLVKRFDVDTNIISGNIDQIKGVPFGTLVLELMGSESDIKKAKKYLSDLDLKVEVLSHGKHVTTA